MLSYERVIHDVAVICFQDLFKLSDVIILIGTNRENRDTLSNRKKSDNPESVFQCLYATSNTFLFDYESQNKTHIYPSDKKKKPKIWAGM